MAVTFSDDFNRADALLSASVDWTAGIAGNNRVLSNEVALSSLSGFDATSLADATMPDDQYVKMTVTARGGTVDTWPGLMARYTAFGDLYFLQVRCDSTANGDTAQLYKKVSGGFTSLGGPTAITVTIPFTMELRCVGTTISTYIDGVEIHSVTDTSHSSGKVGIYNAAQSGSVATDNTLRLDDFEAGSPGLGVYASTATSSSHTVTFSASTPGKTLIVFYEADSVLSVGGDWTKTQTSLNLTDSGVLVLDAADHTVPLTSVGVTIAASGQFIAAVVEIDATDLYISGVQSPNVDYTTTSWNLGDHTVARDVGLGWFGSVVYTFSPLFDFASSWDQGFTLLAGTGSTTNSLNASRGYLTEATDIDLTAETVTMTTADTDGLGAATGILVAYNVGTAVDTLGASPTSLTLSAEPDGSDSGSFTVSASDSSGVTVSQSDDAAWLTVTPASGTEPQSFSVSADATGLTNGTYNATITVTASGYSNITVPVTLVVMTTNDVSTENALAGSATNITPSVANGEVGYLGYSKQFSVNAGSTIDFAVDGLSATDLDIYRLGHYGGNGKRLVTTVTNTPTDQAAGSTITDSNGATKMAWTTTASWAVPAATVSGLFVACVTDTGGTVRAWIPFVVRNDSRTADVVVKVSDSTWGAAYNYFGDVGSEKSGKDVYGIGAIGNIGDRCYAVSYDRPIVSRGGGTTPVINHWDSHEWALIDWLEENGVDVKYIGSYDLDQQDTVDVLGSAKVFISAGHDEYWSQGMVDNLEAWRDTGKHLLFMSANEVFWRVRWADGGRTMWCYKDTMNNGVALDPVSWTGTFRDTRRPGGEVPESLLTGTFFRMNNEDSIGRAATIPTATYGTSPFWRDTSVESTDLTSGAGLVGFEADEVRPRDTGYALLASTDYTLTGSYADDNGQNYGGTGDITWGVVAVYMSATAGLTVGFGTCQWMWGLSDLHDRGGNIEQLALRQATMNLLYDMGVTATTIQTDLTEPVPVALSTYGVTFDDVDPEQFVKPTKVGTTDVTKQYVGSTPVLRSYVGTTLVFGSAP